MSQKIYYLSIIMFCVGSNADPLLGLNTLAAHPNLDVPKLDSFDLIRKFFKLNSDIPTFIEDIKKLEKSGALEEFKKGQQNEDKDLYLTDLVTKYGYPIEEHTVHTADGYIITIFRVLGRGQPVPVFLMSGIFCSADDWFTAGSGKALPYLLADRGYDVWIGNPRGNRYGRKHETLSPDDDKPQFWDYSFHEIGYYDLPAMIDYVLNSTGATEVAYIGQSQGTTSFFVMCSEHPEYNKKIKLAFVLAPIAWLAHINHPLIRIAGAGTAIEEAFLKALGAYELAPHNELVKTVTDVFCGNSLTAAAICSTIEFVITGFDYKQLNMTNLPVQFGHFPAGSSTKSIAHYGYNLNSGKFAQYDYGAEKNLKKYGSLQPPEYNVGNITAPVVIMYSRYNDWLSVYEDVLHLRNELPHVVEFYEVPYETFTHGDYYWAKDADKLVYKRILEILNEST